jgi:hypothetical protein
MYERRSSRRWLWLALAAAIVGPGALAGRGYLPRWTLDRAAAQVRQRVQSLPEGRAAQFVRELQSLDADAPAVLVPLLAEPRASVAGAAEQTLAQLADEWQRLSPEQAAPRMARLARELAEQAPILPPARRRAARGLAVRLLTSPLDQRSAEGPQILADCEIVLRLPVPAQEELRIAAAPPALPSAPPTAVPPIEHQPEATSVPSPAVPPVVTAVPTPVTPPPEPRIHGAPLEPERLIDASQERPIEPRQLRRPKAMKIEG